MSTKKFCVCVRMRCAHKRLCHVKWFKTNRNYHTHTHTHSLIPALPPFSPTHTHSASNSFIFISLSCFFSLALHRCRVAAASVLFSCVCGGSLSQRQRRPHHFCVFPRQSRMLWNCTLLFTMCAYFARVSLSWGGRVHCRSESIVPKTIEFNTAATNEGCFCLSAFCVYLIVMRFRTLAFLISNLFNDSYIEFSTWIHEIGWIGPRGRDKHRCIQQYKSS